MDEGTPFYTTTDNPFTISSLSDGESYTITWNVVATGDAGNSYEFFATAGSVQSERINVETVTDATITTNEVIQSTIGWTSSAVDLASLKSKFVSWVN